MRLSSRHQLYLGLVWLGLCCIFMVSAILGWGIDRYEAWSFLGSSCVSLLNGLYLMRRSRRASRA